jgi:hypothetical protein
LAKSALAEAEAAASEIAAMPAGTHEVLDQTREAVEREGLHLADAFVEIESGKGADVPSIAIWWLRGGSLGALGRSPLEGSAN